jgi:hypothetical protein
MAVSDWRDHSKAGLGDLPDMHHQLYQGFAELAKSGGMGIRGHFLKRCRAVFVQEQLPLRRVQLELHMSVKLSRQQPVLKPRLNPFGREVV